MMKHGLPVWEAAVFFVLANLVLTNASFLPRQLHRHIGNSFCVVDRNTCNTDEVKCESCRRLLPLQCLRGGGRGLSQQKNQKKRTNQKQQKEINNTSKLDRFMAYQFGDVAGNPIAYQFGSFALEFAQAFFAWKFLSGEAQLFWYCHLVVHGILMMLTNYGVPPRFQCTLILLPFRVMGIYDVWFFFAAFLHVLSCPDGYPW